MTASDGHADDPGGHSPAEQDRWPGDLLGRHPRTEALGWRESLRSMAETTWHVGRAHRWYPEVSIAQPPLTPNGVAGLEAALAIFDDYDLDILAKMQFVGAVHFGVLHAAMNLAIEEQSRARGSMSDEEIFAETWPFLQKLIESGQYPHVAEFIASVGQPSDEPEEVREEQWALAGVDIIPDGIEARLARLPRR